MAMSNAIRNGNLMNPFKTIRIVFSVCPKKIRVEIHDQGSGFQHKNYSRGSINKNRSPAGGGILRMQTFMSTVELNDVGNKVVMEKY